jgi:exodeoxyribonuclease VII large subunit
MKCRTIVRPPDGPPRTIDPPEERTGWTPPAERAITGHRPPPPGGGRDEIPMPHVDMDADLAELDPELDDDAWSWVDDADAGAPVAPSPAPAAPRRGPRPGDREHPLSVSAVLTAATACLERGIGTVWIEGEIVSLSRPSSGHVYFCVKDDRAQLRAVMWRADARRLRFRIEDGQHLRCRGQLGIYERDGKFQLYVGFAEPAGLGADALAFEQLKARLVADGLFEPARKRPLPRLPRRIGVVTSRTGAALRDIIRVVHRRFPVPLLVADAQVQGADAPRQIVAALRAVAAQRVDLVIIGRGGGSASDLAAFNDERVVRAVAACPVPTISAVGHEVDVSLTDLAADRRAATPSNAGEIAVPVLADLAAELAKQERRLHRELALRLRSARQELDQLAAATRGRVGVSVAKGRRALGDAERRLTAQHPRARVAADRGAVRQLEARAAAAIHRARERRSRAFWDLAGRLDALSPLRVLERGFAIATAGEHVLVAADQVAVGDAVAVRLAAGALDCTVVGVRPAAAAPATAAEPAAERTRGEEDETR